MKEQTNTVDNTTNATEPIVKFPKPKSTTQDGETSTNGN